MPNFLDYLHWRGDLDFSLIPFNEIDAAIFAMLSYVNMSGIVPGCDSDAGISIRHASGQVFSKLSPAGVKSRTGAELVPTINTRFNTNLEEMFRLLAACPRFADVRISRFEENTDIAAGRQFAAVTFTLPVAGPRHVVAFRGTDNTLVGWKEDFGIVYMEQIPAQDSAQKYLEQTLQNLSGSFVVCGHSKGGNLAVFAGAHACPAEQNRISKIYNFDGPGFNFSIMDPSPFQLCHHKVLNFVPEESMIGMLFDSVGERIVVSSLSHSVSQHNAFFWNLDRQGFIRSSLADTAKMLDHILNSWVSDVPVSERQEFFETFFDLLGDMEDPVITLDPVKNLAVINRILKKYKQLDPETRSLISLVFGSLSAQAKRTVTTAIQQKLPGGQTAEQV